MPSPLAGGLDGGRASGYGGHGVGGSHNLWSTESTINTARTPEAFATSVDGGRPQTGDGHAEGGGDPPRRYSAHGVETCAGGGSTPAAAGGGAGGCGDGGEGGGAGSIWPPSAGAYGGCDDGGGSACKTKTGAGREAAESIVGLITCQVIGRGVTGMMGRLAFLCGVVVREHTRAQEEYRRLPGGIPQGGSNGTCSDFQSQCSQ